MPLSNRYQILIGGAAIGIAAAAYGAYRYAQYEEAERQYMQATQMIQDALRENTQELSDLWKPIDTAITAAGTAADAAADTTIEAAKTAEAARIPTSIGDEAVSLVEQAPGAEGSAAVRASNAIRQLDVANQVYQISKAAQDLGKADDPAREKEDLLTIEQSSYTIGKDILQQGQSALEISGIAGDTAGAALKGTLGAADNIVLLDQLAQTVYLGIYHDRLINLQAQLDKKIEPKILVDRGQQATELAKMYVDAQNKYLRDHGIDPKTHFAEMLKNASDQKTQPQMTGGYDIVEPNTDLSDIGGINPDFIAAINKCHRVEKQWENEGLGFDQHYYDVMTCNKYSDGKYIPAFLDPSSQHIQSSKANVAPNSSTENIEDSSDNHEHSPTKTPGAGEEGSANYQTGPEAMALTGLWGPCHLVIKNSRRGLAPNLRDGEFTTGDTDMRLNFSDMPEWSGSASDCLVNMNPCIFHWERVGENKYECRAGSNIGTSKATGSIEITGRTLTAIYIEQSLDSKGNLGFDNGFTITASKKIDYVCEPGGCSPCLNATTHAPIPKADGCPTDTPLVH